MFEVSFDWKPLVEFIKTEHNLQGFLDDRRRMAKKSEKWWRIVCKAMPLLKLLMDWLQKHCSSPSAKQ